MVYMPFKHCLTKSLFLQSAQSVYETKFSTLIFFGRPKGFWGGENRELVHL